MSKRKVEDDLTSNKKFKGDENGESTSDVKRPTFFAERSTEGLGSLQVLPAKLLEELCTYLKPNDILRATLTSKAMNKAISTDPQIMKRIKINLPSYGMRDGPPRDFFGQRVYPTIKYDYHSTDDFVKFRNYMEAIGHSVNEIEFVKDKGFSRISFTSAVSALKLLPNIKSVINFPSNKGKVDPKPLKLPHLESLIIASAGYELSIFSDAPMLENLSIEKVNGSEQKTRLIRFLQAQPNLKYLKVSELEPLRELNDPIFKLKKLVVERGAYKENDMNFLFHHRESLESFTGSNISFLPALQDFSMLKEIKLKLSARYSFEESSFESLYMEFVERLDISFQSKDEIQNKVRLSQHMTVRMKMPSLESFPRLKEFNGMKFSTNLPWANSGIEKICLEKCSFPNLVLPNLKVAKFISIDFLSQTVSDFDNILELTLENCSNAEAWLATIISSPKLRKLELINMEISENCQLFIEENHRDIVVLSSIDLNRRYTV